MTEKQDWDHPTYRQLAIRAMARKLFDAGSWQGDIPAYQTLAEAGFTAESIRALLPEAKERAEVGLMDLGGSVNNYPSDDPNALSPQEWGKVMENDNG